MKHFTIDAENNITVHASCKAARDAGAGVFATEEQFADLIGSDNKRLVAIFNSLPGVKPVTKFANRKAATERIWRAVQELGVPAPAELPTDAANAGPIQVVETPIGPIEAKPGPVASEPHPSSDSVQLFALIMVKDQCPGMCTDVSDAAGPFPGVLSAPATFRAVLSSVGSCDPLGPSALAAMKMTSGVAPCQYFSRGGNHTTFIVPGRCWTRFQSRAPAFPLPDHAPARPPRS
jgi:hypothetical protein